MSEKQAFALKEGVVGFVDAAVAVPPDGHTYSVGEALEKGKGVIQTDDENEIAALNSVDALKQVSGPEAKDIASKHKAVKSGGKE